MNHAPLKLMLASIAAFLLCSTALGQKPSKDDQTHTAPIKWTEYNISSQKLSIQFPKLPVTGVVNNQCSQLNGAIYYAYAKGVIYEFEWHANSGKSIPDVCSKKTKFSKEVFDGAIDEYKRRGFVEIDEATIAGVPAQTLRASSTTSGYVETRWLIWQQDRWLDLGVTTRSGTQVDSAIFLDTLKLSSTSGIDVGKGAAVVLGDADAPKSISEGNDPLIIAFKPRPGYTEAARRSNTKGNIVLELTFRENGSIGAIDVIKALPNGLTEQAIAAARRIPFVPKVVNGEPVSVVRKIEYTFSIY